MPLFLITGINGSGKTAGALKLLLEDPSFKGMPIYQHGIRDLLIPHEVVEEADIKTWYQWIKKDTVLVIDEAQKHFRARSAGAAVPKHVQELEEHRFHGAHIVMITQGVHLLDTNVRALINFHYHYENTFMGRYEWAWMKLGDPTSKASRSEARKTKKPYPKDVFKLYKSAESHLKVAAKIPVFVKVLGVLLLIIPFVIWQAVKQFPSMQKSKDKAAISTPSAGGVGAASGVGVASSVAAAEALKFVEQFTPVVEGRPETAPIYTPLRQVVNMPRVAVCMATKIKCYCYTQQGSRLNEISEGRCRQNVENGVMFEPYAENDVSRPVPVDQVRAPVANVPARGDSPRPSYASNTDDSGVTLPPLNP
jgi:zona occludens toxin